MENVLGVEGEELLADELRARQRRSKGPSCPCDDPYAEASISCGAQPALPMDQRERRRLVMKRKVLRHRPDGTVEVSHESANTEHDNAEPCSLGLYSRTFLDDTISEGEIESSSGSLGYYLHYDDDEWLLEDNACSLLGDFGSERPSGHSTPGRPPTSYIVPQADKLKRTDRVAKFNKYKQEWERFSFPGEDPHQALRWAMRRQMLQPGLPCRGPKRLVPNTYEVPTMKRRESLRWRVRWDLAHCLMPRRNTT